MTGIAIHAVGAARAARPDSEAAAAAGLAKWLCLAPAPTFAIMGLLTGLEGSPIDRLCSSGSGTLPIDGMTAMYALMSLFHLSPWLKLASARPWGRAQPRTKGD
jgi:hypothetical protein